MTDVTIEADKSRGELAVDLLKAYRNWIGLTLVILVLALVGLWLVGALPSTPDIPEWAQATALALLGAAALGYLPARQAIDLLYDPPKRYVVCTGLSPDRSDEYGPIEPEAAEPGVYELTPTAWERVIVLDGELYQWDEMEWPTYEAQAFDVESLGALGTWRGSKSDTELLRREKEIDELRTKLEKAADTSIDTELAISSKVREATKAIGQAIITEHAEASTYNGEQVADVLSEVRQEIEDDTGENFDTEDRPIRQLRSLEALGHNIEVNNGRQE